MNQTCFDKNKTFDFDKQYFPLESIRLAKFGFPVGPVLWREIKAGAPAPKGQSLLTQETS